MEEILKAISGYLSFRNDYDSFLLYANEIRGENSGYNFNDNRLNPDIFMETSESRNMQYNWTTSKSIDELESNIRNCMKCKLGATRKKFVFGSGNPNADIVVVGEAPGADEDEQGLPFVGRAGQLLTKILASIELERDQVYICNILKCRPPGNRNPEIDEIESCEPYLKKQIELINPKLIIALGKFAAQTLLQTKQPLGKLRETLHDYQGVKTIVTFHPAALLRNPNWKILTWADVKFLRKEYDKILQNG